MDGSNRSPSLRRARAAARWDWPATASIKELWDRDNEALSSSYVSFLKIKKKNSIFCFTFKFKLYGKN